MSKLFKLKNWLTLQETVNHLSVVLGEAIEIKDILRLALDKHLIISIDLVNHAYARLGKLKTIDQMEWYEIPKESPFGDKEKITRIPKSLLIDDKYCLDLVEKVNTISGVWDLTLWANERVDIEFLYQQLIDGPTVELISLDGVFLRKGEVIAQLQEDFDDNEYQSGSKAHRKYLDELIEEENCNEKQIKNINDKYEELRKEYLAERKNKDFSDNFYPAGAIPENVNLVIRTSEVMKLLNKINGQNESDEKISTKEKHSYLVLISALCNKNKINPSERGAAGRIARLADDQGTPISEDTVRKILKEIPEALMAREK